MARPRACDHRHDSLGEQPKYALIPGGTAMLPRILPPLLLAASLLAGWEIYCRLADVAPLILPAPSGVLQALVSDRADIGAHALSTIAVVALGFSLSVGFAFLVSIMLHFLPWAKRV
ncbi:hypothetical protein ACFSYD_23125 [Paracoccus aerius]